jgi:hypothetical protein
MQVYTTKMESYNYEGDEEYDEFQARIQKQLNERGWFLKYDGEQVYFIVCCSALDLEWIHAISESEYYRMGFYRNDFPIEIAIDNLKWKRFEIQQYKSVEEKRAILHSMGEEIDIQFTKNEFDYYVKNRYKIASLLLAYELIDIPV